LKKGSAQSFAQTIAAKIDERIAGGDVESGKLDDLLEKVKAFSVKAL
jgi:hypothetical protein